jgi:hypothetical protein
MMQITYAFAGFTAVGGGRSRIVLEANLATVQPPPPYVRIKIVE